MIFHLIDQIDRLMFGFECVFCKSLNKNSVILEIDHVFEGIYQVFFFLFPFLSDKRVRV